jgi:methyl-accepting chemotaxis protein
MRLFKNFFSDAETQAKEVESKNQRIIHFLKLNDQLEDTDFKDLQELKDILFKTGDQISLSLLKFPERIDAVNEFRSDFSESMTELATESKNLATHAVELDDVIQDLKENIIVAQEITDKTGDSSQKVLSKALESEQSIQKTSKITDSIIQDSETQQIELKKMVGLVKSIKDQIQLVRDISDQTNLLSLNASIEAARAGEQGAGFAVVANGVSKLADKTKLAVQTIEKSVSTMQTDFQKWIESASERIENIATVSESVNITLNNVIENKALADTTVGMMKNMTLIFRDIGNIIEEIKGTSERVASSSIEMSETVDSIKAKDSVVKENLDAISDAITDATRDITNQNSIWLLQFIQARRSDHIIWVGKVRECIDGRTTEGFPEIRHTHCKMGTWYYQAIVVDSEQKRIHESMDTPHMNLHKAGANILSAIQNSEYSILEDLWEQMNESYREIALIFDRYETFLEKKALEIFVRK